MKLDTRRSSGTSILDGSWPAGTGMPTYRDFYLEKEEVPVVQPTLEDLLRPETDDEAEEALSLADFDEEQ